MLRPVDLLCGTFFALFAILEWFIGPLEWYRVLSAICFAVIAVMQFLRRRLLIVSATTTAVALGVYGVTFVAAPVNMGLSPVILAGPLTVWTMARWCPERVWRHVALGVGVLGGMLNPGVFYSAPGYSALISGGLGVAIIIAAYAWATSQRLTEESRQDAIRLRIERDRTAVARELHDVVGHSLTVVKVQAQTTLAINDPEQSTETLKNISESSGQALAEVRNMVDFLHGENSPRAELTSLRNLTAGTGIEGHFPDVDALRALQSQPVDIRLTVVRTTQEAVTNMLKHGHKGRISVRIHDHALTITAVNSANTRPGPWRGLHGVSQRVQNAGGEFDTWWEAKLFHLSATIPLEEQ